MKWAILFLLGAEAAAAPTPLTLASAQAIALRNHPRIQVARLEQLVARERVKGAESSYFPTAEGFVDAVDAGNRDTRVMAGGLNNPSVYGRFADGFQVSELITDFGRTSNLVGSERDQARAAAEQGEATTQRTLLNVDVNYFNTLEAQAVLRVARDTLKTRRVLADQIGTLAGHQLRSQLDVTFAQVAVSQAELLMQSASNQHDAALADLANALGYRRSRPFTLAAEPPAAPAPSDVDAVIDEALHHRPDILELQFESAAAKRLARAERDANYPSVSAVGALGESPTHDYRLPNHYAVGGVQMDIPLFAGGSYVARENEARLRAESADQSLRDAEDNASRDVQRAWLNFNTALQRERTSEQLLLHANQAFDLAQARYQVGSSSIVELSDAQLAATQAQIGEANARYDVLIQQSLLRYQTGELR